MVQQIISKKSIAISAIKDFLFLRKTFPHHKHLFLLYTQTGKISADANELIYIFHKA